MIDNKSTIENNIQANKCFDAVGCATEGHPAHKTCSKNPQVCFLKNWPNVKELSN